MFENTGQRRLNFSGVFPWNMSGLKSVLLINPFQFVTVITVISVRKDWNWYQIPHFSTMKIQLKDLPDNRVWSPPPDGEKDSMILLPHFYILPSTEKYLRVLQGVHLAVCFRSPQAPPRLCKPLCTGPPVYYKSQLKKLHKKCVEESMRFFFILLLR